MQFNFNILLQKRSKEWNFFDKWKSDQNINRLVLHSSLNILKKLQTWLLSQCTTDIWQIMMKLLQSTFDHVDFAFNNLKMFPFKCIKTYSAIQFGPTYILETILYWYYRRIICNLCMCIKKRPIQRFSRHLTILFGHYTWITNNNLSKRKRLVFPIFPFKSYNLLRP